MPMPGAGERTAVDPALSRPEPIERALAEILPRGQKPARYTGGELNRVAKRWDERRQDGRGRVSLALVYPDLYDVGMSNLGVQILYEIVNRDDRFLCER